MKRFLYRLVLWVLTLVLMAAIFGFSSQTGEASGATSGLLTAPLTDVLMSWMEPMSPEAEQAFYLEVDHVVRKTAHFCEYALLGLLLCLLMRSYGLMHVLLPWLAGTLYAATDELHQLFQPERSGQLKDVLLDSCGVLCGVLFIHILNKHRRKT